MVAWVRLSRVVVTAGALGAAASVAAGQPEGPVDCHVFWTFDADLEGWDTLEYGTSLEWSPTGNPGGSLSIVPDGLSSVYLPPHSFNLNYNHTGALSIDLLADGDPSYIILRLGSGLHNLYVWLGSKTDLPGGWTRYFLTSLPSADSEPRLQIAWPIAQDVIYWDNIGVDVPFPDCNSNLVIDDCDIDAGLATDCNGNGALDECDIDDGISEDCDGNLLPDECQADCDYDGMPDLCEIPPVGSSPDCNGNLIPDECDIGDGTSGDCNGNDQPDECDITQGISGDCDGNGIPDECDPDLDGDGIPDACDDDVDGDGVLDGQDNCRLAPNADQADLDGDGFGDACTRYVPADYDTIQEAIDAAPVEGLVRVSAGYYREMLTFGGPLTLRGDGPLETIIDADGLGRVIDAHGPHATISGFTIMRGLLQAAFQDGAGVRLVEADHYVIRDCIFLSNSATRDGSAITALSSPSGTIVNNLIAANPSTDYYPTSVRFGTNAPGSPSTFVNNTVAFNDGGVAAYVNNDVVEIIRNCILWGNNDDLLGDAPGFAEHCIVEDLDDGPGNLLKTRNFFWGRRAPGQTLARSILRRTTPSSSTRRRASSRGRGWGRFSYPTPATNTSRGSSPRTPRPRSRSGAISRSTGS